MGDVEMLQDAADGTEAEVNATKMQPNANVGDDKVKEQHDEVNLTEMQLDANDVVDKTEEKTDADSDAVDIDTAEYKRAIEGILFAMGDSVEVEKLAGALSLSEEEVVATIEELAKEYEREKRGVRILKLDNAYQMCTSPDIYEHLVQIAKQPKKAQLTDVLLETLSIVAYKQPVTKAEIEKIRGVSCGHVISKLIDYKLIEEIGRLDAPGRPMLFGTTEDFLRSFGVASLEELPVINPVQLEEFKLQAEAEANETLEVEV